MSGFLLVTTIFVAGQLESHPTERLVPIPQRGTATYVADKPMSGEAAKSDAVVRWNEILLKAIQTDRTSPPLASRNMAIVHAAIYDSVNAVERTHRPYRVDARVEGVASTEAAAIVAAHRTLIELYPRQVETFDAALDDSLQAVPDGPDKRGCVALGHHVAEKILAWRVTDGARRRVRYNPRAALGVWRQTPPGYRSALLPQWRYLTPFAMLSADRFLPIAPPPLTSAAYTEAFREVKELGGRNSDKRAAEQTLIAWFWDDGEGSVTPPGHWNRIAQTVSRQRGLTLAENARLFALLNLSMADAAILCWEGKFGYGYWRPITAIREADRDDNPATASDSDWQSLLTTPPFPSYPSGHSTFSGAAAAALGRFFGTDSIRFSIGSDGMPGATRTFAGFQAAAREAGRSRIYGGIHYEFDNSEGLRSGRDLADSIALRYLLPREDRSRTSLKSSAAPRRHFSAGIKDEPSIEPRGAERGR